jgi:hypothetical protein
MPHLAVSGFHIDSESLGIHQWRYMHAGAQLSAKSARSVRVLRQVDCNLGVLVG